MLGTMDIRLNLANFQIIAMIRYFKNVFLLLSILMLSNKTMSQEKRGIIKS